MMKYVSTRGGGQPRSFEEVLLAGLAPDGGLYVPESWSQLDLSALKGKSYAQTAFAVMYPFVEGCIDAQTFRQLIDETYGPAVFRHKDVVPTIKLKNSVTVMELFHGPTIAFKDVALQMLGRLFGHVLEKRNQSVTIVGATSGDTGSAAIEGCRHSDRIRIFILHPKGRVSDVQRRQMTTVLAPNVHNIALEGTFDDCQNMVKAMFADTAFRDDMHLSAVNSINWARIMAQIVYYVYTAVRLGAPEVQSSFIVPTGNFGNVFAAYCARQMGLPVRALGISTNRNDILTRFFETGTMQATEVVPTLSPSMDIQISSNFERYLFCLLGRDSAKLKAIMDEFKAKGSFTLDTALMQKARSDFTASRLDDAGTLDIIARVYKETGYILDPHTAVGMKGAQDLASAYPDSPAVLLATAHPAKFPDAVEKAIGQRPSLPDHLQGLLEREERLDVLSNDLKAVQDYVRRHAG